MLSKVDNTFCDGKVVGVWNIVQEVQYKTQDLVTETTLLDHIHADVQDILQKLLTLSSTCSHCLFSCNLLGLACLKNHFSEYLEIPCLDCDSNDLTVITSGVAAFKKASND